MSEDLLCFPFTFASLKKDTDRSCTSGDVSEEPQTFKKTLLLHSNINYYVILIFQYFFRTLSTEGVNMLLLACV